VSVPVSGDGRPAAFHCEAVLFDFDGVLVDSTLATERAWRKWSGRHGLDFREVLRTAQGRRTSETVRLFAPRLDAEAETNLIERAEAEDLVGVREMRGARELLALLPEERWAVVTSATRKLATSRLRHAGLPVPPALVAADDVERGKPDPEPYLRGAKALGVAPQRCVVVEDAPAGVRAGRAAGMTVVAVATTHRPEELSEADAVVGSPADIRAVTLPGGLRLELQESGSGRDRPQEV
jgi:sugar-phosphatase